MKIPAYQALQQGSTGEKMMETLLRGVSTREYEQAIPKVAETVGVSRSSVSWEASQAAEAEMEKLLSRDWTEIELLVHLRQHGVDTGKRYLFVIDGAKALRAAIREVFGSQQPVHAAARTNCATW